MIGAFDWENNKKKIEFNQRREKGIRSAHQKMCFEWNSDRIENLEF